MVSPTHRQTTEQRLIESIKLLVGDRYVGDDCAILPGGELVSTDTLVEGTHFLPELISLFDLGWKAIAVNVSDIAAMGGTPRYVLVSLTLPASLTDRQFQEIYRGISDCASAYRATVVGGDLTAGRHLSITVTIIGEAHASGVFTRAGAEPGQIVAVTGDFGASAAGLWALKNGLSDYATLSERHQKPPARLEEAKQLALRARGRGALMDASDGLADALIQIGRASNVGMEVDLANLPVTAQTRAAAARAGVDPLLWAVYGGEDYELVATIPANVFSQWQEGGGCPFTAVGRTTEGSAIKVANAGSLDPVLDLSKAFQHWPGQ